MGEVRGSDGGQGRESHPLRSVMRHLLIAQPGRPQGVERGGAGSARILNASSSLFLISILLILEVRRVEHPEAAGNADIGATPLGTTEGCPVISGIWVPFLRVHPVVRMNPEQHRAGRDAVLIGHSVTPRIRMSFLVCFSLAADQPGPEFASKYPPRIVLLY